MERAAWTDERLDDMVARNESQFERLLAEMASMRTELRDEMRQMRHELGAELHDTRRDMFHGAIAIFTSIVAVLAVLLAQAF